MSELSLRFAARSEIGRVRKNNEDSGYASANLLVVADGMGGHEAGELASAATVAAVVAASENCENVDELLTALSDAVITSGEYIADVVSENKELSGMGTTLTAVALRGDRIAMAHVGDSRAYVMHDGELQQMTKDHTYVQTLVDAGEITPEEAAVHPRRNLMMRAIDGIHAVEVDLSVREAHNGDRFLLCSDGLCGVIPENLIIEALNSPDITMATIELIEYANAHGAPDNVTVIVAEIVADAIPTDPVLIGAAIENETQSRLPDIDFPDEFINHDLTQESSKTKATWLVPVAATVAIVGLIISGGMWWLANQWYVGEYKAKNVVAVYQGIPTAGLSRLVDVTDVAIDLLPTFERGQVEHTIDASTHAAALASVEQLTNRVKVCLQNPLTPGCGAKSQ